MNVVRLKYWLRWVLFPMTAVPGVLVFSVSALLVDLYDDQYPLRFQVLGIQFTLTSLFIHLALALNAFLTVYLAYRIAPAWKVRSAIATYLFWVLSLSLLLVVGSWNSPGLRFQENLFEYFPRLALMYVLLMGPAILTGWLGFRMAHRRSVPSGAS
jgi:hypothetical protein